jgi:hypothetical protein
MNIDVSHGAIFDVDALQLRNVRFLIACHSILGHFDDQL